MKKTLSASAKPGSVARSPFRGLLNRSMFDDFFNQFLMEGNGGQIGDVLSAAMDVAETDQAFEVKMDLPGVDAENVDIQIDNYTLTVRGQRSEETEEKDEKKHFHRDQIDNTSKWVVDVGRALPNRNLQSNRMSAQPMLCGFRDHA